MLRNLLTIPDTFDPDERRRRQVLNILLILCIGMSLLTLALIAAGLACYECDPETAQALNQPVTISTIFTIALFSALLWMNRSHRIPSLLSATIFMICFLGIVSQSDNPAELYNGRSTLVWALPIMISTIIFPPRYAIFITLVICGMFQLLTPPDPRYPVNPVNYFTMSMLLLVTLISGLSMSIANRSIQDARSQAARLQAILNSIADGVLVLDLQNKLISANPALLRMIPEDKIKEIVTKPFEKNMQLQDKSFSITSSLVPGVGSVAVFRDETRRNEIEHTKDALLATVSHELRTPLMAVMNYLEIMQTLVKDGKSNTEKFLGYLQRAIDGSERLNHLVKNVIEHAELQARLVAFKQQTISLPNLLKKSYTLFETVLKSKNLSYELVIAPDVPSEIKTDPDRLHQVLMNLLENAIKFTRQGGIKIHVFRPDKETVSIEIADSGPGIPDEQLPDIFEPFRRGSDYALREQHGVGLGLSITKEIVTRLGGHISVASTRGTGSRFTISLPIG